MFEWLLGLERIHLDTEAPLSVRFAEPPAPWIMLIGALLAASVVWGLYRRETLRRRWRWLLTGLRLSLILLSLFLLGRPMLVLRRDRTEPATVAILLDVSRSMARVDARAVGPEPPGLAPAMRSRWSAVREALFAPSRGLVDRLVQRHHAELWTFAASASRLATVEGSVETAALQAGLDELRAAGGHTDMARAITTVLEQARGRRLASVILVSDGRQTVGRVLETALSRARALSVPIHTVAVGSTRSRRDIGVTSVWSDEDVFVSDSVVVGVLGQATGSDRDKPITLELRDKGSGEVLDRRIVQAVQPDGTWRAELEYRPEVVGRTVLRVVAVPDAEEENPDNNWAEAVVRAHDQRVSVLYVEDTPRYEYRYLKNLLLREPTIESSCLLLSATPGFTQEGSRPIQRFPRSVEELGRYDVVILGDVDPRGDWLSPAQAAMIVDFVSLQGGGLAFIAGERNMPHRLRRTRLEKLLPVKISPRFFGQYVSPIERTFAPQLTAEGRNHSIFRFAADPSKNRSLHEGLAGWFWFATVEAPKPAVSVLAVHPSARTAEGPMPVVVLGRYGAGRTFYLGSDDLWRWRAYAGERLYQNVWIQVIRTLARGRKLGMQVRWRLETGPREVEFGRSITIELVGSDRNPRPPSDAPTVSIRDEQGGLAGRVTLSPVADSGHRFAGEFRPTRLGRYTVTLDPSSTTRGVQCAARTVSVVSRNPEETRPEADYALLKTLARRSAGSSWTVGDDLGALIRSIPDRSERIVDDIQEPLWDTRLALAVFLLLLVTEWIIRKARGLS